MKGSLRTMPCIIAVCGRGLWGLLLAMLMSSIVRNKGWDAPKGSFIFFFFGSALRQGLLTSSPCLKYWGWPVGVSFALWKSWWSFPCLKEETIWRRRWKKSARRKTFLCWGSQPHGLVFCILFFLICPSPFEQSQIIHCREVSVVPLSVPPTLGWWQLSEDFSTEVFHQEEATICGQKNALFQKVIRANVQKPCKNLQQ